MPSCSAFGCTNRSDSKKKNFVLPNPRRNAVKNPEKKVVGPLSADKGFYICVEHFEESCFEKDLKVGQKQSLKVFLEVNIPEKQAKSLKYTLKELIF